MEARCSGVSLMWSVTEMGPRVFVSRAETRGAKQRQNTEREKATEREIGFSKHTESHYKE